MPKLPTAEEVFGMRQIPQAQRNVIGYDTSAISQANIRAGQTIENVGQGMVKFGMSQLDEKERQQEKDIRDRERAEARLERENLKFDSILEARARSDYLLKSIELKEKIRSDPNFDMKSGLEEFSKIKQNYIGMFKTPEGTSAFENFDVNTVADLRYDLGGIVLQRQQNAFLADTDNQIERLATAMSQSKDQNEIAQMAQTMRALVKSKRAIPGINEEELAKQDRGVTKQTALASYYAMSDEEKARVLFGGQDEYYDSEKPSGADYGTVTRSIENNTGNPKAKNPNSSAKGRYQWTDATAKQYGLLGKGFDYRGDAEKEEVAFKKYTEDNRVSLNASLGRNPTDAELYLAHQQGAGGAAALLSNPDTNAIEVLKSIGVSAKTAKASIVNNGGNEDMTAGEFANKWISKYEEKAGGVSDRYKGTPLAHLDRDTVEKLKEEYVSEEKAREKAALDALELPALTQIQNENSMLTSVINNPQMADVDKVVALRKANLDGTVRGEWVTKAVSYLEAKNVDETKVAPEEKLKAFEYVSDLQKELYYSSENGAKILESDTLKKFDNYRSEIMRLVAEKKITPSEGQQFLGGPTGAVDSAIEAKKSGGDWMISPPGLNDYNFYALEYLNKSLSNKGLSGQTGLSVKRQVFSRFGSYLGKFDSAGKFEQTGKYISTGNEATDRKNIQNAIDLALKDINIENYAGIIDPNKPPNMVVPKQVPQVGEVRGGYKFKGGNPADKANWEKVNG